MHPVMHISTVESDIHNVPSVLIQCLVMGQTTSWETLLKSKHLNIRIFLVA